MYLFRSLLFFFFCPERQENVHACDCFRSKFSEIGMHVHTEAGPKKIGGGVVRRLDWT